jgi:hypothetical protein
MKTIRILDPMSTSASSARGTPDRHVLGKLEWGHSPHKDPPAAVLEGVSGFVARVIDGRQ